MDKRFQVFVSSTYEDLREERAAVISALLQIDCFPSGMELFPAADDDSLTLIKSVIDDCDYYLIVLAGRYGSIERSTGKSYTHLEYEYALAKGKPTIALLHSNPGSLPSNRSESTDDGRKRLEAFRGELREKNCRLWAERSDLIAAVFTGVQHLKKTRTAIGWVRALDSDAETLKDELLRVRRELESVGQELDLAKQRNPPDGSEGLARGNEKTTIMIELLEGRTFSYKLPWKEIIRSLLPQTFGFGADEIRLGSALASLARENPSCLDDFQEPSDYQWQSPIVSRSSFGRVMNQLVALGLIEAVNHPGIGAHQTLWRATRYGLQEGCRQVAEVANDD